MEVLQAHNVPHQPWERIAMDYFYMNGRLYILICDYFSKFPFIFQIKTMSFANLKVTMGPPLMAKNSVLILQVLASDTPHHHQTTHKVMASLRDRSRL